MSQQNFIGVLVDDSRSMQIADEGGQTRGAVAPQQFAPESPVMKSLSEKFMCPDLPVLVGRARLTSPQELTFGGSQTRSAPRSKARGRSWPGLPLAGIVMVSDGADTTDASLSDALLALKAADVPVFTVGVGRRSLTKDIQIGRISVPRSTLKGTSILVDAVVTHRGFPGETVMLDVEDEGRIVGSQEVRLPADGEPAAVRVRFTAAEAGPRMFRFKIAPQAGRDGHAEQRARDPDRRPRRAEKILYFEGEPRFEYKFIRRAVADDSNLQVIGLQRTADNKYYRQDLDDKDQLFGGFPKTREELFAYRGLILGSIEAGAFTGDQLRMIADFVEKRGGGLLMLGGPRAFAEGRLRRDPGRRRDAGRARAPDEDARRRRGGAAQGPPDARRHRARGHAARRQRAGVGGDLGQAADADQRQRAPRREAGGDDSAERHRRTAPRAGRARVRSATAAARRSRSRSRIRGSGRCTPTSRSRT